MKIWEILKEENIDKYVELTNINTKHVLTGNRYYNIGKTPNGNIGLFTPFGAIDFYSTEIMYMEFNLISRDDVEPEFKVGDIVKISAIVGFGQARVISGIEITDEYRNIGRHHKEILLTIKKVLTDWKYNHTYKVEQNDLIWTEDMLELNINR